jgi:hypothetical protein
MYYISYYDGGQSANRDETELPQAEHCGKLVGVARDVEHDIKALADRARSDREFAVELYGALCNASWRHDDGADWPGGTWRHVAGVVADLRGCGEDYLDDDGEWAVETRADYGAD